MIIFKETIERGKWMGYVKFLIRAHVRYILLSNPSIVIRLLSARERPETKRADGLDNRIYHARARMRANKEFYTPQRHLPQSFHFKIHT